MPQQLPLEPSNAHYSFSTTLDGTEYLFDVRWNGRDGAWYFDLLDADEDMIRAGNKVTLGSSPGVRSSDSRFPAGAFLTLDASGAGVEATYEDIGTRVLLLYYSPEELAGLVD
jgi:hypothetical protein